VLQLENTALAEGRKNVQSVLRPWPRRSTIHLNVVPHQSELAAAVLPAPVTHHLNVSESKCPHFQSCVKVSGRSPQPSRRCSAAKCHKKEKKPQQNISPPGTTVLDYYLTFLNFLPIGSDICSKAARFSGRLAKRVLFIRHFTSTSPTGSALSGEALGVEHTHTGAHR